MNIFKKLTQAVEKVVKAPVRIVEQVSHKVEQRIIRPIARPALAAAATVGGMYFGGPLGGAAGAMFGRNILQGKTATEETPEPILANSGMDYGNPYMMYSGNLPYNFAGTGGGGFGAVPRSSFAPGGDDGGAGIPPIAIFGAIAGVILLIVIMFRR